MVTSWIPHYGGAVTKPLDPEMFDPLCPSDLVPFRVGDKWAGMIIQCLEDGPRRFSELRVPLRNITSKVLTQSLRALERDGFIVRTVHAGPARHVEYELTSLGRSLLDLLDAARTWAEAHLDELIDAHETHQPPTEPANPTPCPRPDTSS
ncbi:winged helix-turn-helix transcriptional regulator [Streptomyces sp. NPDC014983]|uniref:winged helix-turn-helix transcriptional regulator n=1 Tax=Streptomyces sp. NPDC014983 TaxID=3364933 RepID=UPI0036F5FE3B